ncbi:AAA family ATPase [Mycobacterium sp. 3-98]|uniref:AAA family ATPase n=1 Tax=Mycobacterium sp. 3-98 TaxID=3042317 RepID=UPI002DDB0379|nr:AAA family ATPase [Mycobacterium sp. 3-98]WSE46437.1 AAA family ATPase [Mycobacterium sp. 3-98]
MLDGNPEQHEPDIVRKSADDIDTQFAQYVRRESEKLSGRRQDARYAEEAQDIALKLVNDALQNGLSRATVTAVLEQCFWEHLPPAGVDEIWALHQQWQDEKTRSEIQNRYYRGFVGHAANGGELLSAHTGPPPAQWGQGLDVLWVTGEPLMIEAGYGCGKTTLAGLLVRAQLFGGDVLGYPVRQLTDGQKILYLAIDRPDQIMRSMARQFRQEQLKAIGDRLTFWKGPLPDDAAENTQLLVDLCEYHRADFVYVDSLKDAARGLTEDRAAAAYQATRSALLATGRQLVELHHLTKSGGDYGSVWLRAGAGSVLRMSGKPGGATGALAHDKAPAHKAGTIKLSHERDTGEIRTTTTPETKASLETWVAGHRGGVTLIQAAEYLYDSSERAAQARAKRVLNRLTGSTGPLSETRESGQPSRWFACQ